MSETLNYKILPDKQLTSSVWRYQYTLPNKHLWILLNHIREMIIIMAFWQSYCPVFIDMKMGTEHILIFNLVILDRKCGMSVPFCKKVQGVHFFSYTFNDLFYFGNQILNEISFLIHKMRAWVRSRITNFLV